MYIVQHLPLKRLEAECLAELELLDRGQILSIVDGKVTSAGKVIVKSQKGTRPSSAKYQFANLICLPCS